MRKSDQFFNILRLPVDYIMLVVGAAVNYALRTEILSYFRPVLFEFELPFVRYIIISLIMAIVFVGAYASVGLYNLSVQRKYSDELLKIITGSSAAILIAIIYTFFIQEVFDSRYLVLGGWFFAIIFVFLGRVGIRLIQRAMASRYGYGVHNILIVGNNDVAHSIESYLNSRNLSTLRHVGTVDKPDLIRINEIHSLNQIDEIIVASSRLSDVEISDIITYCHEKHIAFKITPSLYQVSLSHIELDSIGETTIIEIKHTSLDGWGKVTKRLIDIFASLLGLVVFLPIFFVVALAIKWETEGPVFVRLLRISGSKVIYLIKFRSMIANAEELKPLLIRYNERSDGPLFKMRNDPRITKVGRILRKFRIDEMPQLWNVFVGDISLVGPRPHQPDEISRYNSYHKKVLAIKAGATGLAQVSGSSDLPFDKEVAIDRYYIENWSLLMDIKIIIRTLFQMFSDKTAN